MYTQNIKYCNFAIHESVLHLQYNQHIQSTYYIYVYNINIYILIHIRINNTFVSNLKINIKTLIIIDI